MTDEETDDATTTTVTDGPSDIPDLTDFNIDGDNVKRNYGVSVILSQQASRFSMPFDLKQFETLTPREYLEKYCRVSNRRHALYKRIFDKHKGTDGEL
ncbi:unnamed protein product, partial [Didymodactylos carnosus]